MTTLHPLTLAEAQAVLDRMGYRTDRFRARNGFSLIGGFCISPRKGSIQDFESSRRE